MNSLAARLKTIPLGFALVALVSAIHLGLVFYHWHDVPPKPNTAVGIADPDPWLRLTIVRDWLTGGGWYNHEIARTNAPFGGIASPWTRPLDLVIAAFVKIQPTDVDLNTRLVRAAMLVPWLFMTLLLAGVVRAVRVITPIPAATFIGIALILSAPMMRNYFGLAYADHHSFLAATFIWALGGVLQRDPSQRVMLLSGALLGLLLWISPEALALIGMIYLWYGIAWLTGERTAMHHLSILGTGTALASAIAVMVERPLPQWFIPVYDSISVVYVFLLAGAALVAWLLRLIQPPTIYSRLALAVIGTALLSVALWCAYPLAFQGPLAGADPFIFSHFLPNITEARPLFTRHWPLVISLLIHPALVIVLCVMAFKRRDGWIEKSIAAKFAFFFAITLLLFLAQMRWYYYFYPVVALIIAPWLAALFSPEHPAATGRWPATLLAHHSPNAQTLRRLPLIAALFLLPLGAAMIAPEKNTTGEKQFEACSESVRKLMAGGKLNALGNGKSLIFLTHTNYGGEMLFWTPHRIIASNYHREGAGIKYVWESADITDLKKLRRYLAERQVDVLMLCPYAEPPKDSILQALQQGKTPPAWLTRVAFQTQGKDVQDQPVAGAKPAIFLVRPQ